MYVNKKTITKMIIFVFLSTQIFAYTISFMDILFLPDTIPQKIIDDVYGIRNICFCVCALIIIIKNRIKFDDILLVFFIVFSYAVMLLFFPENKIYFLQISPLMKYMLMAYFVIRADFFEFNELKDWLIILTRILNIIVMVSFFCNIKNIMLGTVYMSFANALSINIAILMFSGIIEEKKIDMILSGFSMGVLLIYGSRGALLTLFLLAIYMTWLKNKNTKKIIVWLMLAIGVVVVGPYVIMVLLNYLKNIGIDSRTIESMLSGELFASSSRMKIYEYLFSILKENLLFGVGICGDRYYLPKKFSGVNATYAHNLLLELLLDYGIIVGTIVIILISVILIKGFIQEKDIHRKGFFSVFVLISIIQLMLSRSWLTEQNLFILLALLLTYSDNLKVKFLYRNRKI